MPDELKPTETQVETEGIEVDLTPAPKPEAETDKVSELEKKHKSEIDSLRKQLDGLSYIGRKNERMERELGDLKTKLSQLSSSSQPSPQTETAPKVYTDELDKLKTEDPWKAVDVRARQIAQEMMQEREAKSELDRIQKENFTLKESNIAEVIQHYPDLHPEQGNPDSDVSRVYADVLNKNPRFLYSPDGPALAEREMEKEFMKQGVDITKQKRAVYMPSKQTPTRRGGELTSLPPGRTSSDSRYTLTSEEKEMCERYGIPLEEYAKNAKTLETPGGEVTA